MNSVDRQFTIGLVCFLVILVDGYDTTSIAFVAPALILEWKISAASLTPAFIMTSLGAVIGYVACGPLDARWGSRRLIIASIVWFSVFSLASASVDSIAQLAILRLITGIGLGTAVPTAIALAANHASERLRTAITIVVATGLPLGSAIGASIGSVLIADLGWRSVFVVGGVAPLLLLPALWFVLPKSSALQACSSRESPERDARRAAIWSLLQPPFLSSTVFIWMFALLNFLNLYAFLFWLPTLLAASGLAPSQASIGSATFAFGGVLGNLAMLPVAGRVRVQHLLAAAGILAIVCMLVFAQANPGPFVALLLIGGVGAGLTIGCVGQATLSVTIYPPAMRTTAIGCAAALGRIGSMGGPAVGGALLAAGWNIESIVCFGILPSAATTLIALLLLRVPVPHPSRALPVASS